jgi:hypothetical protein
MAVDGLGTAAGDDWKRSHQIISEYGFRSKFISSLATEGIFSCNYIISKTVLKLKNQNMLIIFFTSLYASFLSQSLSSAFKTLILYLLLKEEIIGF